MKKRTIIILLVLIILLFGGGVVVWKLNSNQKKSTSPTNQQKNNNPTPTPLNKLSDQELEKCLLEDFSRRLELKKCFVFGLGELKTLSEHNTKAPNERATSPLLSDHLTKISQARKAKRKKKFIAFLKKKFVVDNEWRGGELDKKIKSENYWIVFEKDKDNNYRYFGYDEENPKGEWNTFFISINEPDLQIGNKSEILKTIKTDPAISGEN